MNHLEINANVTLTPLKLKQCKCLITFQPNNKRDTPLRKSNKLNENKIGQGLFLKLIWKVVSFLKLTCQIFLLSFAETSNQ